MPVPAHRSLAARRALRQAAAVTVVAVPAAPPAPPPVAPQARTTFTEQLERFAKALAVLLGGLYVLGLLVSNAQLLRLGSSNFSLLQAKSIATGLLFLFYVLCAAAIVAPPVFAWVIFEDSRARRAVSTAGQGTWLQYGLWTLLAELAVLSLVATFYGALLPWGLSFDVVPPTLSLTEMWQVSVERLGRTGRTLKDLLWHWWLLFLFAGLWLPVQWLGRRLLRWAQALDGKVSGQPVQSLQDRFVGPLIAFGLIGVGLLAPYVIGGFSRDIYPNLVQSMGGGQPDIVQLQPAGDRLTTFGGIDTCCYPARPEPVVTSEPLVVWHESDKFLYVTALPKQPSARQSLVAIDLRAVRAIQYLPKAVRVGSGDRILEVYEME